MKTISRILFFSHLITSKQWRHAMGRLGVLIAGLAGLVFALLVHSETTFAASVGDPIPFSGSTIISESTAQGLIAIGGSGQLTLNSGVTVTRPPGGYGVLGGTAVDLQGFNYTVINRGTIGGYGAFWDCIGGLGTFGCFISQKYVEGENSWGINFDSDGSVENFGTITATSIGIDIAGTGTITNHGTINTGSTAIRFTGTGNATIINSGIIQPGGSSNAIETGVGNDSITLLPGSVILGPIVTQDGNDTLILGSDASSLTTVDLGLGDDTLELQNSGNLTTGLFNKISNLENLTMNGIDWSMGFNATFTQIHIQKGTLIATGSLTGPLTIDAPGAFISTNTLTGNVTNNGLLNTSGPLIGNVLNNGDFFNSGGITGDVTNNGFFNTPSSVSGNVTSNGIMTNGDSIGTMTVTGNYTHGTTGNLFINLGRGTSDVLSVGGTATLNGGTVSFLPTVLVTSSDTFMFLTSGGLTGNFDTVVSPLLFDTTVTQVINDLEVTMTRNATYESLASNGTQQQIATALDASLATASGDMAQLMLAMDQLVSPAEIQDALDQMNPEASSTFAPSSFATSQLYNSTLIGRLNSLRSGAPAVSASLTDLPHLAMNSDNPQLLAQSFSSTELDVESPVKRIGDWIGFVRTFGSTVNLDSEANHVGFDANTFGIMFGMDKWTSDRWIVGGSMGLSSTGQEFDQSNWDGDIFSFRLAGHAAYTREHWYWNGILSYALNQYSSERILNVGGFNRIAEGDHSGHEFSIYNGGGYKFSSQQWSYGPIASVQYITLMEDGYEEQGAGMAGLKFDSVNTNSLRSAAGGFINRTIEFNNGVRLIPEARAQWAHEWMDTEFTTTAQFLGGSGGSFEIQGRDLGTDSVFAGVSATAYWSDRFVTALNYNIDTGRNGFTSYMFDLKFSYRF